MYNLKHIFVMYVYIEYIYLYIYTVYVSYYIFYKGDRPNKLISN